MAKIEKMLQMMAQRNVNQVLMLSNRPFQIFANSSRVEGPVISTAQLCELIEEITPPTFAPNLQSGGKFQFRYESAFGSFDFGVENIAGELQVSIAPANKAVMTPVRAPSVLPVATPATPVPSPASVPQHLPVQAPLTPTYIDQFSSSPSEIYIAQNGQSIGPMTPEAAQQGVQNGWYALYDMAIAPHLKNWDSLQNVLDYYGNKAVASVSQGATVPAVGNRSSTIRMFLNEEQDPAAVANVVDRLREICTPDETILYIAVQRKLVNIGSAAVALTTKRIIIFRPKTLGLGLDFEDFSWMHVLNTHMSESLMGATFTVQMTNNYKATIDCLPKAQARKLYQFGQQKEEHMHRYRRELLLEEKRAGASNISMVNNNTPAPQQFIPVVPTTPGFQDASEDPLTKLQQLKTMLEMRLISEAEYNTKKAEIMSRF